MALFKHIRIPLAAVPLGALLIALGAGAPAHAQASGQWQFTGSLATGHDNTHLVQLADGRVLAISGGSATGVYTATAEVYDPATGQWTPAGTLTDPRAAYGQPSVLPDGDVLVAGGQDPNVNDFATAELYDPATNQWTLTGSLNTARRYPVQVALSNGEVLVATGAHGPPDCSRFLTSAELYNPATGQWTYTGSTSVPRESATGIRLADGRVLLAGGYTCGDTDPVTTEIYDPATGQWSQAGDLPHGWLGGTMVMLPDHRVLMVDGWQHSTGVAFADAVIFDPATGQWSQAAPPMLPRSGADATLLPDGDVLVSQGGQLQSEIYDPATNSWTLDATALDVDNGGQTILLPTGNVLLAGGDTSTGPATDAELYTPASPPPPPPMLGNYVAMGDSYSAGEGNGPPYVLNGQNTDTSSDKCHRSAQSYPALLATDPVAIIGTFTDVACSGALTEDFGKKNHLYPAEKAQIKALSRTTSVVTLTIGGNDVGFASVLEECVHEPVINPGYGCSNDPVLVQDVNARIAALHGAGSAVTDEQTPVIPIQRLLDLIHKQAPLAAIYVAGYPRLFGSDTRYFQSDQSAPSQYICPVGSLGSVDFADAQWLNSAALALDNAIAAAVSAAQAVGVPATYVSAIPANFAGHGLCDSGTPWFHPLMIDTSGVNPGSFHPTPDGQSDGYEAAFLTSPGF